MRGSVGAGAVFAMVAACLACPEAAREVDAERILARFEGGVVTAGQLDAYLVSLPAELRQVPADDPEGFAAARIREIALRELWLREAHGSGVDADPAFAAALRDAARRARVARRMAELLPPLAEPSEAELRARYDADPARFERPARRLVRHWYLRIPEGTAPSQAIVRLEALRRRHRAGASFGELARAHSESQSRHEEGSLGWLSPADLPPPLADLVFALEVGATSEPVVFGGGAHVFLVEQAIPSRRFRFDEVRPRLASALREEARGAALEAALAERPLPAASDLPGAAEALERILRGPAGEVVARVGPEALRVDAARRALAALRASDPEAGDAELAGRAVAAWVAGERLLQASEDGTSAEAAPDPRLRDELMIQTARERSLRSAATEEVLRRFHARHALRFATPLRLALRRVAVPLGPDPDATMAAFEAVVASEAPTLEALRGFARARGGDERELGWRALPDLLAGSPRSARLVASLPVGGWSPPHRVGEELISLRVEAREEPEPRPFEAVRQEVERAWLAQHGAEQLRAVDDALLAAAGFELVAAEPLRT